MRKPYKAAVWGPGGLGAASIREINRLPETELVGVFAYSESKVGQDAGSLTGMDAIGVKATNQLQELIAAQPEVVIYTARDLGNFSGDADILALLEAGINVITPLPYHYLKVRGKDIEQQFIEAGKKGGATLHGCGITPGFFNERLAISMTSLSNDVEHIRMQEFFNAEDLAESAATLDLFGFGKSLEEVNANDAVAMMAENYLTQPIHYAADQLGVSIDRIERVNQHCATDNSIEIPATTVPAGTVGTLSYAWTAYVDGKPFYTTEVYWYLSEAMRPAVATCDDFWVIEIEGRPSTRVTIESKASIKNDKKMFDNDPTPPGYYATVVNLVQSIPMVIEAEPGVKIPAMPEVHWKPDMRA